MFAMAAASAALAACGGGGGGGADTTGNTPPTADGGGGGGGGGTDNTPPPPPAPAPPPNGGGDGGGGEGIAQNWSDPKTWGGSLPPEGAEVVIPAGKTVVLDTDTKPLGNLRIDGTMKLAEKDVELTAKSITVSGTLQAGTADAPFQHKATFTLTGAPDGGTDGQARGLRVTGGKLLLFAASPMPQWTKLNDHASAGAKQLQLATSVNWKAQDQIVVAPTDHYGVSTTELLTLAGNANGATVNTTAGLAKSRWGKLQYPTATGLSLTKDPNYKPPVSPAPTQLDERAAVGNLSRHIVIQGADDNYWRGQGFGAHVMAMSLSSLVQIDGVEFRRVGQAGQLARYPIHWHLMSYDVGTGKYLGDTKDHFIRNSAIWNSANRCVVLHGTNGVTVKNNICYDVKGHAFFLEDAVERRNVLDGNLALKMRSPEEKNILKIHERPDLFQGGPSGLWITNPDNVVINNHAGDATGNGIWLSFPLHPLGLSRKVNLWPRYTPLKQVENNTVHTARTPGLMTEWVPVDDNVDHPEQTQGQLVAQRFVPMKDGKPCLDGNGQPQDYCGLDNGALRLTIKRTNSFKNNDGAYRNRVTFPDYLEWTVADNANLAFAGAAFEGSIQRGLMVGTSLNHSDAKYPKGLMKPAGIGTYHSTVKLVGNTFMSFPFVEGTTSGAFSTEDYYMLAVERGRARNSMNRLIGSDTGYRTLQPGLRNDHDAAENWGLSSALWDTEGQWGPKNWYTVPNVPFLTLGANCQDALPAGRNGKTCDGEYYGVESMQTDFDSSRFQFMAGLNVSRQSDSGAEIAKWRIEDGYPQYRDSRVAQQYPCQPGVTPPPGNFCSWELGWMRHWAARSGGRYQLSFPGRPVPKWLAMNITNASGAEDSFVMAVPYDGRLPVSAYVIASSQWDREQGSWDPTYLTRPNLRVLLPAASLAEVKSSPGNRYWQDAAHNLVWIKHQGGIDNQAHYQKNSDDDLYRVYSAVFYPTGVCTGAGSLDACLARIKNLGLP